MTPAEICGLTLVEVRDLLASGALTAEAVMAANLAQAQRFQPTHNLFLTLLADEAMSEARAADRAFAQGQLRGPLHGVPFHVKDNIDYGGVRTSAGSKILEHRRPAQDATAVARLRAAGGISIGQTWCVDLVGGWGAVSPFTGSVPNPWNPELIPGHSSSGTGAAVSLRVGYAGIGTDVGGSVRNPASLCGVVGLKATHGLVSIAGLVPTGQMSADHIGPIARTVDDVQAMLEVMMGPDSRDPHSYAGAAVPASARADLRGVRIGIPTSYFWADLDPEIEAACTAAVDRMVADGAERVPVTIETIGLLPNIQPVIDAESYVFHEPYLAATPELYTPAKRASLLAAQYYFATDYVRAQRARARFAAEMQAVSSTVDILAMPTSYIPAHRLADATAGMNISRQRMPFNQCGLPAISVPCAVHSSGAPFGLQLTAGRFEDFKLLAIARVVESLLAFDTRPPILRPEPALV
jgi:aspartyl-tRNA(Asn)/glutamyl-tRNA(Gln) amidotransferase subunit A